MANPFDGRKTRYVEATLLKISTIFAGIGQAGYVEIIPALGVSGFCETTNIRFDEKLYKAAKQLWSESKSLCYFRLKSEGRFGKIVGLFDGAWLHRGYASRHGSASVIDVDSGCNLWTGHIS